MGFGLASLLFFIEPPSLPPTVPTPVQNSVITHAVGPSPTGPFGDEEVVLGWFAHNPKPIQVRA